MLIKLTNAHADHKDKSLIINTEYILSFYPTKNDDEEEVVFAFGVQGNVWHIKETIDEIMEKINAGKVDSKGN